MVVARSAAIGAAGVEMAEELADFLNGFGLVLFLDVHVERIEMDLQGGTADIGNHFQGLIGGVDEISLETVEGFEADDTAFFLGVFGEFLEVFDDRLPLLGVFLLGHGVGTTYFAVNRPDEVGAIEHDHLIDQLHHVGHGSLLMLGSAAQITPAAHAGADGTADQTVLIQLGFDVGWIDMGGIFHRNFDGLETPFFELGEKFGALVRKRRGEEESIDSESHSDGEETSAPRDGVKIKPVQIS